MTPYYEDESVRLFHGGVVECHTCQRNRRDVTARGFAGRTCHSSLEAWRKVISRLPIMWRRNLGSVLIITLGWATMCQIKAGGRGLFGAIETLVRAGRAEQSQRKGITSTATQAITKRGTLQSSAAIAIWNRMAA